MHQPYTPATIAFIRKEAENGRGILALADMLGWSVTWLRKTCKQHGVTFSDGPPLPDAKPDVGFKRRPGPPPGTNRFSIDETINVRIPAHISELLRRQALREGVTLSYLVRDMITKSFEAEPS